MRLIINKISNSVYSLCFIFCLLTGLTLESEAQSINKAELKKGMSDSEVLQQWGAPKEKIEYESKREVVWIYGDKRITLQQGKVKSWRFNDEEFRIQKEKKIAEEKKKKAEAEEGSDEVVEEILDELLKQTSPSGLKN